MDKQKQTTPPLLDEIQKAMERWKLAQISFDWSNREYTDWAIHNLNAGEQMLVALLREAKKANLVAWPPGVDGLFTGPPEAPMGKTTESADIPTESADTPAE